LAVAIGETETRQVINTTRYRPGTIIPSLTHY
jgi:hypothetical protein